MTEKLSEEESRVANLFEQVVEKELGSSDCGEFESIDFTETTPYSFFLKHQTMTRVDVSRLKLYLEKRYGYEFAAIYTSAHLIREELKCMIESQVYTHSLCADLLIRYCLKRLSGQSTEDMGRTIKRKTMANTSLWFDFVVTHPVINPSMREQNNRLYGMINDNRNLASSKSDGFWNYVLTNNENRINSQKCIGKTKKKIQNARKRIKNVAQSLGREIKKGV